MILSVFLAIGESWEDFQKKGQDKLLLKNNFYHYSKNFEKVYIFSYGKKSKKLFKNIFLLGNKYGIHRFIYAFIFPLIYWDKISQSKIIRGMQLTGGIPGIVTKIIFGKRIIINYGYDYGNIAIVEKKYIHYLLFKVLEKIIFNFIDGVIVTTKTLKAKISKLTYLPLYLIPNSIDVRLFRPIHIKKSIDILFVGRLEQQKNLMLIIDAVAKIKIKLKVVFIGDGKQKQSLKIYARENQVNLTILSPKPHNLLVNFYNKAKIFVLSSFEEGHPKALLEAMSCGIPIIGTNVTGIKSLIHHNKNGLLSKLNAEDLTQKIHILLNNQKLREKVSVNARHYIIDNYNSLNTWKKEILLLKS